MTEQELQKSIERIVARFDLVNVRYVESIANAIRVTGALRPTDIAQIDVMTRWGTDIGVIESMLAEATRLGIEDIEAMMRDAVEDIYEDERFKAMLDGAVNQEEIKASTERIAGAVFRETAGNMENIMNSTSIVNGYAEAVDKVILGAVTGGMSYEEATRQAVAELNVMRVTYESGYQRRTDSSVRMSVLDGMSAIQQQCANQVGDELGYDCKEVSAHFDCALDHEGVQGRIFTNENYEIIQALGQAEDIYGYIHMITSDRPLGIWNCRHIATPFHSMYSVAKYTPEELAEMRKKNHTKVEWNGRTFNSVYEAGQMMRRMETEHRTNNILKHKYPKGSPERLEIEKKNAVIYKKYMELADASGLMPYLDRL